MRPFRTLPLLLLLPSLLSAEESNVWIQRAHALHLSEAPAWQKLLHMRRTIWGWRQSEIDDSGFFLSPHGRRDPQAELEATIQAFVETGSDRLSRSDTVSEKVWGQAPGVPDPPGCRYPARYAWLNEQLHLDATVPAPACPRFEAWRAQMNAQSATLVFASYYMNNPASMYGHTFLKLNQPGSDKNPLLDYSANFAATVTTRSDLLYALYGLAGLYRGKYSTLPYYMKIQEYNHMESRDLWEYRLTFSPEEVDRLVAHLWELGHTSIAYYFFNKNCSYQLLPVLEVARPALNLSSGFWIRVVPADTLRRVTEEPGLVAQVTQRPSHVHRMLTGRERLSKSEIDLATRLAHSGVEPNLPELQALSPERQALVLDSAHDYFRYRVGFVRDQPETVQAEEQALLLARSKLQTGTLSPSLSLTGRGSQGEGTVPPDQGHPSLRINAGHGFTNRSPFEEVAIRGGLHDLLDPPLGYLPGNTLEMFHIRLRHNRERKTTYVQQASLADILSLPGWDRWVHPLSWRIRTGLETADDLSKDPENSLYYGLRFGSGVSYHSHLWKREIFYLLSGVDAGVGHVFDHRYRAGFGGQGGAVIHLASSWRIQVEGDFIRYPVGQVGETVRWRFIHAVDLSRRLQWRTTLERQNQHKELLLTLNLYL